MARGPLPPRASTGASQRARPRGGQGNNENRFRDSVTGALNRLQNQEQNTQDAVRQTAQQGARAAQGNLPSTPAIIAALIIAILYDALDIFLAIITGGTSKSVEWMVDFIMQGIMKTLLKDSYTKLAWLEFVPGFDLLPWYTVTALYSWYKTSKAASGYKGFLSRIGRSGGPSHTEGIIIFLSLMLGGGFILFLIFGLPIALLFAAVVLAIMLFYFDKTRGIAMVLVIILIIGAVGYGLLTSIGFMQGVIGTDTTLGRILAFPGKAFVSATSFFSSAADQAKRSWQRQVYAATGDYYTGKVDENAEQKLGVYLENVKQADPKLYEDQPVTIYATLVAKTLDNPINITIACKAGNKTGNLYPQETFSVDVYEERDIDCTFDPATLGTGTKIIEMSAVFDFKTMAYVKSYFMNQETLRSLRRQEVDPLGQYGITDTKPQAIYTNGPVMVGMSAGSPPIGVDNKEDKLRTTLGITIDNNWKGKVKKITKLFVIVPSEFIISSSSGLVSFKKKCSDLGPSDQGCDDTLFNIYELNPYAEGAKNKEFDTFKTYRVFLEAPSSAYTKLLGGIPVSTKYFKVLVEYEYALEKKKTVEIFKPRGTGGLLGPTTDTTGPTIVGTITKTPTPGGITLKWKTDEASNDIIEYWAVTSPHTVLTYQEFGRTTDHTAALTGLGSGKAYGFKIVSRDEIGNEKRNPNDSFTTG